MPARQAFQSGRYLQEEGEYPARANTGAALYLTKGAVGGGGGRALYLAWNYSGGSIALHSNGRLIDGSYRLLEKGHYYLGQPHTESLAPCGKV